MLLRVRKVLLDIRNGLLGVRKIYQVSVLGPRKVFICVKRVVIRVRKVLLGVRKLLGRC